VNALPAVIGPPAYGQGSFQVNLFIAPPLAARFLPQGSVSWIYYADRLNQLPLGLIGIGVGTAILPLLSRQIGSGDAKAANDTQNRALELALFLALPAAIALLVSATPLIRGVFQHGAFTAADTLGCAATLAAFAPGVPAYVLIKVLTPGFYARGDTRTPVRIAFMAMLVNLVGNLTLVWPLGAVGIALSTAISAWVNVILLYAALRRADHRSLDDRFRAKALRIVAAGLAMGAALYVGNALLDPHMGGPFWGRIAALALLCGGGGAIYGLAAIGFGAYRLSELKAQLRRRR